MHCLPAIIYMQRKLLQVSDYRPGAHPTTSIYNDSIVNFYNATGSLARFKNYFFLLLKTLSPTMYNTGVVAVKYKSRRIGSWVQSYDRELHRAPVR
jgi:hypothetical protein